MITSISNNIRTNKIFYLKENTPLSMNREKQKMQLSAVHLSSIIQSKKKEAVNEQMVELAKKINETNPFRPFLLTERPKSQHALNIRKSELTERNIYTSSGVKPKKSFNPSDFYLSDIIEEKWNDKFVRQSKQQLIRYQRSLSSKKAYKLRKYEFKIFLKQREAKPVETKAKEIKQIVYEKQQVNKWGQLNPVLHTSRLKRFEQRRKNLDVQLKVQGNSFQPKKQKKQKQEQY